MTTTPKTTPIAASGTGKPPPCPYRSLPKSAYWREAVARPAPADLDPVVAPRFKIGPQTRIATAGSCFAQHVARYLQTVGDNYFVTEPGHPILSQDVRKAYNYGVFSARFGNIYTTRQLVQLFDRAHGAFTPQEEPWADKDGLIDPFRPAIQPGGFASREEFDADRVAHFAAVRRMFAELDVFVFTLGLTEGWAATADGAVLPVCPGCGAGGSFDPSRYVFFNESVADVTSNMRGVIERLRSVNPDAKVLMTVSPVPLIATYSGAQALTATTYSKSVLRAAAGEIYAAYEHVDYFPSYEIITGGYNRGAYFAEDLRSVREEGVHHVMKLIFRHYLGRQLAPLGAAEATAPAPRAAAVSGSAHVAKVVCEEELLAQ